MALAEYGNAFNIDTDANGDPILIDAQSGQTVATYDRTQSAWVYGDIISDSVSTEKGQITGNETVTLDVPSDYATVNDALNDAATHLPNQDIRVTINIESGHEWQSDEIELDGDDLRYVTITSADAEVTVATGWDETGAISADNSILPVWDILLDCNGQGNGGLRIRKTSRARIMDGAGVKNSGGSPLRVEDGSAVVAVNTVWTGGTDRSTVRQRSIADLQGADFSDSTAGRALRLSSSSVNLSFGRVENCSGNGIDIQRTSTFKGFDATISNNGSNGIGVQEASICNMRMADLTDNGEYGIRASQMSFVNANNADVSRSGGTDADGIWVSRGSVLDFNGGTANDCGEDGIKVDYGATADLNDVTANDNRIGLNVERGATVAAEGFESSNNELEGAILEDGARVDLNRCEMLGNGRSGVSVRRGTHVNLRGGRVENSTEEDVDAFNGVIINAHGLSTTNGSPDVGDTTFSSFNDVFSDGLMFA